MKYVLDSSVGFKTLLAEQDSDKAQRLCEDYRNHVHELLCPDIFAVEIAHGVTRAERQGRITPTQGARLLTDLMTRIPAQHASLPLLPRAYRIAGLCGMVQSCNDATIRPIRKAGLSIGTSGCSTSAVKPHPVVAQTFKHLAACGVQMLVG